MRRVLLILFILFEAVTLQTNSQVQQEWLQIYDSQMGQYDDGAASVAVDASGYCYVTGTTEIQGNYSVCTVIKYTPSGSMEWIRRDTAGTHGSSIEVGSTGDVFVLSHLSQGSLRNYVLLKYSSSGNLLWRIVLSGPTSTQTPPHTLVLDVFDNVYVSGSIVTGQNFDYTTYKYNSSGTELWVRSYSANGTSIDVPYSIAVNNAGDVFVTGYTSNGNNKNYSTIKYNSTGVLQWSRLHNGTGDLDDIGRSVIADNSGNVYVTGNSCGSVTMDDYVTIKYSSSGDILWLNTYNGTSGLIDIPFLAALDVMGNVIITGQSMGFGAYVDIATIKYSPAGSLFWTQRYSGESNIPDIPNSLTLDEQGSIYIAGRSGESETGSVIVKYNSSGIVQWIQEFGQGVNNTVNSIKLDNSGSIYATGTNTIGNANTNFITIKYSQPLGIQPVNNEIPRSFSLDQNYPNPFNPSTKILFAIPRSEFVQLKIYDALGREIEVLVNELLNQGTYEVNWNATDFPSRIYFYKLVSGDFTVTKKMILIK